MVKFRGSISAIALTVIVETTVKQVSCIIFGSIVVLSFNSIRPYQLYLRSYTYRIWLVVNSSCVTYFVAPSPTTSTGPLTGPCNPNPCQNNDGCLYGQLPGQYFCNCVNGYSGDHCQTGRFISSITFLDLTDLHNCSNSSWTNIQKTNKQTNKQSKDVLVA